MREILLVRAAESEANVRGRLDCAVPGPGLTAVGEQQALELARRLRSVDVCSVWASTMSRALRTAEPLARRFGLATQVRDGLREVNLGDLHARVDGEAHDLLGDLRVTWLVEQRLDLARPGGETAEQALTRLRQVLREVFESYDEGTAVVVSHGEALRLAVACLGRGAPAPFVLSHHLPNLGTVVCDVEQYELVVRDWDGRPPP